MIVDERIITFINSMDTENSEILETIEQEALAADVPIIRREMQSFLEVLLLMKKPNKVEIPICYQNQKTIKPQKIITVIFLILELSN